MAAKQLEIICSACGADTLLVRIPRYDGFTRVGDTLKCASCGHEYAAESEVPFKQKNPVSVFDESDAPRKIVIFREDEKDRTCLYCRHYVVNPFVQRCGLHRRLVEATDFCDDFEVKKKEDKKTPPDNPGISTKPKL